MMTKLTFSHHLSSTNTRQIHSKCAYWTIYNAEKFMLIMKCYPKMLLKIYRLRLLNMRYQCWWALYFMFWILVCVLIPGLWLLFNYFDVIIVITIILYVSLNKNTLKDKYFVCTPKLFPSQQFLSSMLWMQIRILREIVDWRIHTLLHFSYAM